MTKDELDLDQNARRAIWAAYKLLITLADEKTADSKDPVKAPKLSTAQDGAQRAPSQRGA